jgi:hypothetical protein
MQSLLDKYRNLVFERPVIITGSVFALGLILGILL